MVPLFWSKMKHVYSLTLIPLIWFFFKKHALQQQAAQCYNLFLLLCGQVLLQMKRELRSRMEHEIEELQKIISQNDEDDFIQGLEVQRLRHRMQMASFQFNTSYLQWAEKRSNELFRLGPLETGEGWHRLFCFLHMMVQKLYNAVYAALLRDKKAVTFLHVGSWSWSEVYSL